MMENVKYVSFDVFDTVITRKCYRPKDVFRALADKWTSRLRVDDFKRVRMECETSARDRSPRVDGTLNEIYKEIQRVLNIPESLALKIRDDELALEKEFCFACSEMAKTYKRAIQEGFKVIFVSDMYLDEEQLADLLRHCGYTEFERVFTSGTQGCCKWNGGLYDRVCEVLDVSPDEIWHIGDNYHADILQAKAKGINVLHIPNLYNWSQSDKACREKEIPWIYDPQNVGSSILTSLLAENEPSTRCVESKIGYHLGIVFYEFTRWVLENSGNSRILFNSRDGWLPWRISNEVFKREADYLRTSRQSVFFGAWNTSEAVNSSNNQYIYNCLRYCRYKTVSELLEFAGLDPETCLNEVKFAGFDGLLSDISAFQDNRTEIHGKLETLLKLLQTKLYEAGKLKKQAFEQYLETRRVKSGDVFVDIGWNGSLQSSIERITGMELKGLYFEVFSRNGFKQIDQEGFLSNGENKCHGYTGILESIFTAPEGSVTGYKDGKPVLSGDMDEAKVARLNRIHKGIIEFCQDWHELKGQYDVDLETVEKVLFRFLKRPTLEEVEALCAVTFENGSDKNLETVSCFNEGNISSGHVQNDYCRSYWKEAYIMRLENSDYAYLKSFLGAPDIASFLNNYIVHNKLKQLEKTDERFAFYGGGTLLKEMCKKYRLLENPNFVGVVDRDAGLSEFCGKPVFSPETALDVDAVYLSVLQQDLTLAEIDGKLRDKVRKIA